MKKTSIFYRLTVALIILGQFVPLLPTIAVGAAPSITGLETPNAPAANPISISRVQSSYTAGQSVIEFAITNNLPPTRLPEIPESATVTDTIGILSSFVITDDVNTLRGITLLDTLVNGTTLLDASGNPVVTGSTLTWDIPDIPPSDTTIISMTVQTPAPSANFIDLDTGAQADADLWGEPVSGAARPAVLIPSSVNGVFTLGTVDADSYDTDMLWRASTLTQDPIALFELVRGFAFEAYEGSLRGTRGTLWGESGNAADQASLLIAMLRAAGVPARYRHGSLSTTNAQTLLASMFPAAQGLAGTLPAGTPVADPVNDPDLIALASDHWWVEAYLPGSGWTDLDPAFASAQPGDVFASPGGNDRIAELPDNIRHKIDVRLLVEKYNTFPLGGANTTTFYPLEVTFPTAELASKRLTLGHLVSTEIDAGIFTNITHTFTPYFSVEENNVAYEGEAFQDFISNFPLSTYFTTAEWIEYEIQAPDGSSETFTRTVKDLIGADVRVLGGNPNLQVGLGSPPFALMDDLYVNWVIPNDVSSSVVQRWNSKVIARMVEVAQHGQRMIEIVDEIDPGDDFTPEQRANYNAARTDLVFASEFLLTSIGLDFAYDSDEKLAQIETGMRTKMFYNTPRVFTVASVGDPTDVVTTTIDLRRTTPAVIVYPGQAEGAALTAQWAKGIAESELEGAALENVLGVPVITTVRVFDEMELQGINPVLLTPSEAMYLDVYPFSSEARAHMLEALIEGKHVLAPSQMVLVEGEETIAWWEFNPETGETVSVGENGLHISFSQLAILVEALIEVYAAGAVPGGSETSAASVAESAEKIGLKLKAMFEEVAAGFPNGPVRQGLERGSGLWRYFPAYLCPIDNCGIEQFFAEGVAPSQIPLPEMLFSYGAGPATSEYALNLVGVTGSGGGAPAFTLDVTPGASTITPDQTANFQANINSNFDDDFTIGVYAPEGWHVAIDTAGVAAVQPVPGAATGVYTIDVVAQSNLHPELFDTATHTVTINSLNDVIVTLNAEANITVPMGAALASDVSNQTNDSETEVAGAAYTIDLRNPGQTANTYNVSVSGPSASWVWLNGANSTSANVTLPAGGHTTIGLYLKSPAGTVPAPGTNFSVNVSATAPGLSDTDNGTFSMPNQPFNYLTLQPNTLYLGSNSSADFTIEMTNVGNGSGSFPVTSLSAPVTATVTGLPSPVSLNIGETQSFEASVNTAGIPLGARFPIVIGSDAPGSYTQYAIFDTLIVSETSEDVFIAADNAKNSCTLGEPGLSDALEALALSMVHLEASCLNGECDLNLRDQSVNAAYTVALYSGAVSQNLSGTDAVVAAADDLASHTDDTDILNDLGSISAAVVSLDTEVCAWSDHKPDLQWTPYFNAALIGQPANFDLDLTNEGALATTYALTVTLPLGVQNFNPTVNPGATETYNFPVSGGAVELLNLAAYVTVSGQSNISDGAAASLNVVDKFVQVTSVNPDPSFVDTGISQTTISVEVANIANVAQSANARTTILDPLGATAYTADTPISILIGPSRSYELQTVDTSGWDTGVYTVSVDLLDTNSALIPDGSGYGFLGVGQLVGVSHTVEPEIAVPGTFTVTTTITTEVLNPEVISITHPINESPAPFLQRESLPSNELSVETISPVPGFEPLASTFAITRTEDTTPTIVYSGTWATITNIFASHTSGASYTWSNDPGDTATFVFTGTWTHIGFATDRDGGEAEIFIDGISQGTVDTYAPSVICILSDCLTEVVYGGLADTAHTLEIVVAGTAHPNASGIEVKLDYIDTWDGTTYTDGTFEQDDTRIMRTDGWFNVSEPAASGGSYMNDGGVGNSGSVWFPFTGDSATFGALARYDSNRVHVWVDGVWQGNPLIYSGSPISKTVSFSGFGPGPHIMRVGTFRGEANVDAFITPAVGPDYDPPSFTGLVRYEEDHPSLVYNGYDYYHRPSTWAVGNAGQTSDYSYISSSTISDTVSLTFDGSWLNIGLRTRNRGGLADVSVDGVSIGTINAYSPGEDVVSAQFDLITGTHTVTITVLGQSDPVNAYNQVYLDYIEIYDASPVTDTFQNALKAEESGRVHVTSSVSDGTNPNAIEGDYVESGLPNSLANVWYSFVGDSFTFYGLTVRNGGDAEVYVDGQLIDTVTFDYPFSVQPYAFHYTGFDPGPHSVRIHNVWEMRVDGFSSNPPNLNPYQPVAEWWDDTPKGNGAPIAGTVGIAAGMAVGDVNNDGSTEIVVTADDLNNFGTLFVYRGDGQDTGGGTPILWDYDFGGGAFRTWVGSPAIADLDGVPGAEIVVAAGNQLFAFHGDGSTYWITDTVSIFETLSSPAIGNIDLDPEPEIVINVGNTLEVRNFDGSLAWSTVYPAVVNPPVLTDLTGDGLLDILVTGWDDDVLLYDFNFGSPQLVWTTVLTTSMAGTFGAPAIADIDGMQPGGDAMAEIAIASNGQLTVLNGEDGSHVWTTVLEPGNPGGVTIADLDGDDEVEIVTGMRHEFAPGQYGKIYALNADGSLLWDAIAEDSTSANNASTLDLDGDGIYEVAWNGKQQGFTIFNGADGTILFNEPLVFSLTGTDYPLIADVDDDGQAEIVVPALGGVRVFGYGDYWSEARALWNQHSYHITNINDDLSVPFSELNSWDVHNTYRTQTNNPYPLPVYAVAMTHTIGLDNVTVLTDTFNTPPTTSSDPTYGWDYSVSWETITATQTFSSELTSLQPGETRMVAQGTTVDYTVLGGSNHLELPPLYVSVPHIIALDPASQSVGSGGTVQFSVTVTNPLTTSSMYTLSVSGFPGDWGQLPGAVPVPSESAVVVDLTVEVPTDAAVESYPFLINVSTDFGGIDQTGGMLTVVGPLVEVDIAPKGQTVPTGDAATFTLSVTNLEGTARTYDLSSTGLAPVTLPAQVVVGPNSAENVIFTAQAVGEGANPFTIDVVEVNGASQGADTASVSGDGFAQVAVEIVPGTAASGPGVQTPFEVVVTNLGVQPDFFDLSAIVPIGWSSSLAMLGQNVGGVYVAPGESNAVTVQLLVTPATNAGAGDYGIDVTAASGDASDTGSGTAQVGALGVTLEIISGPGSVVPGGSGAWDVRVTNNGTQADTYDLSVFGVFAQFAEISPASVTLGAGGSQVVALTASGFGFMGAGENVLGAHAQSQTAAYVQGQDTTTVDVLAGQGVIVEWQPDFRMVDGTTSAVYALVVTNTGNLGTTFELSASGAGVVIDIPTLPVFMPAFSTAVFSVLVEAPGNGSYDFTATADSGVVQASDTATLVVDGVTPPVFNLYLPLMNKGD